MTAITDKARVALNCGAAQAEIDVQGAQLRHLSFGGTPVLWEGDETVWKDSSPWLFPLIGQLRDGYFLYEGKKYEMPMHGFAKGRDFEVSLVSPSEAVMTLRDSEDTLKLFPWRFELVIRYALTETALSVGVTVNNTDQKDMYMSLGAHPGLLCQAGDELIFEGQSSLTYRRLTADTHLLKAERETLPLTEGALSLSETLFKDDAIIIEGPDFDAVTLRRGTGDRVKVRFPKVPWLGVWSRGYAPLRYVCIEPWLGVDDPISSDHDITHKEAINKVPAGDALFFNMTIEQA